MKTSKTSFLDKGPKTTGLTLLQTDSTRAPRQAEKSTILVVDASPARRRSIAAALDPLGHTIIEASTASEALCEIAEQTVHAVLVDLFVPELGAVDFCRKVKVGEREWLLPVIVLSRSGDIESEVLALDAGADRFLLAPIPPRALRARVEAVLRHRAMVESLDETETVLFTLAQSVEERDPALGQHCERMALMAAAMGVRLGLPCCDVLALQRGAYLHDVGKVAVPDSVLLKPGPLTPLEWEIMKSHAEKGEKICRNLRSLAPVLPIIRHHHEKWDGSGYPDGLKGSQIPLLARILQAADIYDALTAVRPYKRAFTPDESVEIMRQEVAKGWRDPAIIRVFEDILPAFNKGDEKESSESLAALAESVEKYRRNPGRNGVRDLEAAEPEMRLASRLCC